MIQVTASELLPSGRHCLVNVLRPNGLRESALFYTEKIKIEDGSDIKMSSNINMMFGKNWEKYTDSPNYVYRIL